MTYRAKQGDILILDFDPRTGHEQKGRRPALVVSGDRPDLLEEVLDIVTGLFERSRT
jgi:mRNA-degrading endonuclease toxin of MazEF toxin-antitoxin module